MPTKTDAQRLGEIGAVSVMSLCTRVGWTADLVSSDYGEDLICQTFLNGEVDSFRVLIQVKASKRLKVIQIKVDHLRKWIGSIDLVIIAFWSEEGKCAYYCVPGDIWHLADIIGTKKKSLTIKQSDWNELSEANLKCIEWRSRIRGLNLLSLETRSKFHNIDYDDPVESVRSFERSLQDTNIYISAKFLGYIGLVSATSDGYQLDSERLTKSIYHIKAFFSAVVRSDEIIDIGFSLDESLFFLILWLVAELAPSVGVPGTLLEEVVKLLNGLVKLRIKEIAEQEDIPEIDLEKFLSILGLGG